ncbi:hypothetical protein F5Y03DRAFT_406973 [Xylaria venustula]|nr:hypothetical protein F5Y03DRAFT_406973 [Xylaria venustula]
MNSPSRVNTARTQSLEIALRDNLTLEQRLNEETKTESPNTTLRRLLSVRTVVTTFSSSAERQQQAVDKNAMLREIGTGSIGKVFEHPGTVYVYKLPLLDDIQKIWNNYVMNMRIQESFDSCPYVELQAEVPRGYWFAKPDTAAFWEEFLDRFPFTEQFPRKERAVFCMERIFPLPLPIRNSLVDIFVPLEYRDAVRGSPANKDCLVRPILGRKKYGSSGRFFSLRNFKLHVDQIQELGLNAIDLASSMGHALAVLHWHTGIDACDIEFVLGSSPQQEQAVRGVLSLERVQQLPEGSSTFEQITHPSPNFKQRVISLWILDFDACTTIKFGKDGVAQAVKAFFDTEPYCPRPCPDDVFRSQLWTGFEAYLRFSSIILKGTNKRLDLAELFIRGVEDYVKQRQVSSSTVPPRTPPVLHGKSGKRESSGGAREALSSQSIRAGKKSSVGGHRKNRSFGEDPASQGSSSGKRHGKK